MLIKNGIAPSSLLRTQLELFEQAEDDQRMRLVQLWCIVPPNHATNGGQPLLDSTGKYQSSSAIIVQEETRTFLGNQKSLDGIGKTFDQAVSFANNQPAMTILGRFSENHESWKPTDSHFFDQPPIVRNIRDEQIL